MPTPRAPGFPAPPGFPALEHAPAESYGSSLKQVRVSEKGSGFSVPDPGTARRRKKKSGFFIGKNVLGPGPSEKSNK